MSLPDPNLLRLLTLALRGRVLYVKDARWGPSELRAVEVVEVTSSDRVKVRWLDTGLCEEVPVAALDEDGR